MESSVHEKVIDISQLSRCINPSNVRLSSEEMRIKQDRERDFDDMVDSIDTLFTQNEDIGRSTQITASNIVSIAEEDKSLFSDEFEGDNEESINSEDYRESSSIEVDDQAEGEYYSDEPSQEIVHFEAPKGMRIKNYKISQELGQGTFGKVYE